MIPKTFDDDRVVMKNGQYICRFSGLPMTRDSVWCIPFCDAEDCQCEKVTQQMYDAIGKALEVDDS